MMYNDMTRPANRSYCINTEKIKLTSSFEQELNRYNYSLNYSGVPMCLWCGEPNNISDHSNLMCLDCDDSYICYNCGERISASQVYWVDGEPYCEHCYDNATLDDDITDEPHDENNYLNVSIIPEEEVELVSLGLKSLGDYPTLHLYCEAVMCPHDWDFNYHWSQYFEDFDTFRKVKVLNWGLTRYWYPAELITDKGWELLNER